MAFIFALIIFAVLIGRSLCERGGKIQFQRECEVHDRKLEEGHYGFDLYIASKEETDATRLNAFYESVQYKERTPANEETMLARKMRERIWNEVHIQPNPEMVTCAMLAQKGLVPSEMSWCAYCSSPAEPRKEFWDVENRFLRWLDNELMNHGMSFRMRYVTVNNRKSLGWKDNSEISEPIQQDNARMMGTYYWTEKQGRYGKRFMIVKPYDYNSPFIDYNIQEG